MAGWGPRTGGRSQKEITKVFRVPFRIVLQISKGPFGILTSSWYWHIFAAYGPKLRTIAAGEASSAAEAKREVELAARALDHGDILSNF